MKNTRRGKRRLARGWGISPHQSGAVTAEAIGAGADVVNQIFTNPHDAPAGQTLVDGGGPRFQNVVLNLIFWGAEWGGSNPPVNPYAIVASVNTILNGSFYLTALSQYGFRTASVGKVLFRTGSEPNAPTFTHQNVADFVKGLIDDKVLREPDEVFTPEIHFVFMPTTATFRQKPPPAKIVVGAHSYVEWDDYDLGDVDNSNTYFAWIGNPGLLAAVTTTFSHELVEAITDPEGSGIQVAPANPTSWNEIGDVCSSTTVVNGVAVQSYWSQANQACVVPVYQPPPPPPEPAPNTRLRVIAIRKSYSQEKKHTFIGYVLALDPLAKQWTLSRADVIFLIDHNGNEFFVHGNDGSESKVIVDGHTITTVPDASTADNLLSLPPF